VERDPLCGRFPVDGGWPAATFPVSTDAPDVVRKGLPDRGL